MDIKVTPSVAAGEIIAPPSKSFAHRYLIAAFLSGKKCTVENIGGSDDVSATLSAIERLGAVVKKSDNAAEILGRKKVLKATVDCGESGSTLRFLLPVACALGINAEFIGKGRLSDRPIDGLAETLAQGGAKVDGHKTSGKLKSGRYTVDAGVSSQFITGMLFALSVLDGESELIMKGEPVSAGYIGITLDVLRNFGAVIEKNGNVFTVRRGVSAENGGSIARSFAVEGDWSGAAFPLSFAALCGKITVYGLKYPSLQSDVKIIEILRGFGAKVTFTGDGVTVEKDKFRPIKVDCENTPDIAQIVSVLSAFAEGKSEITGIERLRIKESDRINAIITTLNAAGIKAEYDGKTLTIAGGKPHGGIFFGGKDHRTVMSVAVLCSAASGDSVIKDAGYYAKSYPAFIDDMNKTGAKLYVGI